MCAWRRPACESACRRVVGTFASHRLGNPPRPEHLAGKVASSTMPLPVPSASASAPPKTDVSARSKNRRRRSHYFYRTHNAHNKDNISNYRAYMRVACYAYIIFWLFFPTSPVFPSPCFLYNIMYTQPVESCRCCRCWVFANAFASLFGVEHLIRLAAVHNTINVRLRCAHDERQ